MCCDIYFRQAIHSPRSDRGFIRKHRVQCIIPSWDTETKSEQEGDSDGN